MTVPLFFGEGPRRLFGVYDPPAIKADRARNSRTVVFCPPWGADYYVAHGALRRLATNLAMAGHHVLRFDYFGVGDSAGEGKEGDIESWLADIDMAVDEAKSIAQTTRVCLLGLRLGATLAANFAAGRSDTDALVLWDPVVRGREYVDELDREHAAWLTARTRYVPFPPTEMPNRMGTPFSSILERQIIAIDVPKLAPSLRQKILLVITEDLTSHAALIEATEQNRLTIERVSDREPWRFDALEFGGPLPTVALNRILEWIG